MDRLTERMLDERPFVKSKHLNNSHNKLLNACAAYEDAEEQGYIKRCPKCDSLRVQLGFCMDCGE